MTRPDQTSVKITTPSILISESEAQQFVAQRIALRGCEDKLRITEDATKSTPPTQASDVGSVLLHIGVGLSAFGLGVLTAEVVYWTHRSP